MTRLAAQLRLAFALSACAFAAAFATTGACRVHYPEPPPIRGGRYVLTASGSISVLPALFTDSAGRTQRIYGDTIDIALATSTYTEHGRVALVNADGTTQPPQSFVIGPRSYTQISVFSFDLPSTIVGPARLTDATNPQTQQIMLNKAGLIWFYVLR